MLLSLRDQTCLLSSVEFLCFGCRNDAVCMVSVSSFEGVFCESDVCFRSVIVVTSDGCLVDN